MLLPTTRRPLTRRNIKWLLTRLENHFESNQIFFYSNLGKVFHLPEFQAKLFLKRNWVGGSYKRQPLNTVFLLKRFLELILIWSGFLCQIQINYGQLVMNENTGKFWNLFLLQVNVTRYFYLLVTNGNLTRLFFTQWFQLKLTNQWFLFPR